MSGRTDPRELPTWSALYRLCREHGLVLALGLRLAAGSQKRYVLGRARILGDARGRELLGVEVGNFNDDLEGVARYLRGELEHWLRLAGRSV